MAASCRIADQSSFDVNRLNNVRAFKMLRPVQTTFFAASFMASLIVATTFGANQSTWYFSGVVRQFQNDTTLRGQLSPLELAAVGISPGTILTGQLTIALDSPDTFAATTRGSYNAIVAVRVSVGTVDTQLDQSPGLPSFFLATTPDFFGSSNRSGIYAVFGLSDSHGLDLTLASLNSTVAMAPIS